MSNNIRTLVIDEGSEFKIKVEKLEDFNDSFFKDIYDSAAVNVKEILDNTEEYYKKKKEKEFFKDKEESNNIIAFTGERGTGKSSVMISFAEALKTIKNSRKDLDKDGFEKFRELGEVSFVNLDIIDPALLEDKESIFEIVIAKMFSKFKEYLEKEDERLEFDDKKRLLKKFQKVYRDLKIINTDRKDFFKESAYSEDILQTLVSLASGSNMRKSFMELVNEYLQFFSNDNDNYEDKEKRFLVIPIDDLDMNIKHSAEMAEQIRKYLMVPNVIILMAVKIEQLKDSMEQMYRKNYEVMLKAESLSDDPKEMAERYIEKLIPNGRKLYLPEIRAIKDGREKTIELIFNDKKRNKSNNDDEYSDLSIEEIVLKMTYKKTGLIFIKTQYDIHYLVPDNLRELQNYLIMLNKMNENNIKNVEKFETYFMKTWIKRNLSRENVELIEEFHYMSIMKKNKFIITKINTIIYKDLKREFEETAYKKLIEKEEFIENVINNKIFDINNTSINISMGDVLEALRTYNDYDSIETKKLKFSIKTIYSIILHKLVLNEKYDDIRILLGGSLFGRKVKEFLPNNKGIQILDNYLDLNIDANMILKECINKVVGAKTEKLINSTNIKSDLINAKKNKKTGPQIVEWLFYFLYLSKEVTTDKYRNMPNPYYNKEARIGSAVGEVKNAKFDITAFAFFALSPDQITNNIYSSLIEQVNIDVKILKDIDYLKDKNINLDNEEILMKFQNNILEMIKNQSNYYEILDWRKKYKVVLPIYSIETIEYIINNIRREAEFKKKSIGNYDEIFINFIKGLRKCLKKVVNENEFLKNENDMCFIIEAYDECPIIKTIVGNDLELKILMKNILKNIELININKDLVDILNDWRDYFSQRINQNLQKSTLINNINKIIKENGSIFSEDMHKNLEIVKKLKIDNNKSSRDIALEAIDAIDKELGNYKIMGRN